MENIKIIRYMDMVGRTNILLRNEVIDLIELIQKCPNEFLIRTTFLEIFLRNMLEEFNPFKFKCCQKLFWEFDR